MNHFGQFSGLDDIFVQYCVVTDMS